MKGRNIIYEAPAAEQQITLKRDNSAWPSVAGLVLPNVVCPCGVGPVTRDRGTPKEFVLRIGLISGTLVLARFLATLLGEETGVKLSEAVTTA